MQSIKTIPLTLGRTIDLAVHPGRSTSYVTIFNDDGGRRNSIESKRVLDINERTGKIVELPRIYGTFVEADPTGKYLFIALRDRYERGLRIDWHIGRVMPEYGEIDLLLAYDMSGRTLRHVETNLKAGANGSQIVASPDGRNIAYVSGGGTPTYSYSIPAFQASDVNAMEASYKTGAYPKDVDFHPVLDLVVGANGKECKIFKRSTGEELDGRFTLDKSLQKIQPSLVHFTPSGSRMIVGNGDGGAVRGLASVRLELTEDERRALLKGTPRRRIVPQRDDEENPGPESPTHVVEGEKIPRSRLQALAGKPASRAVSAKEIARFYTASVVQVKGDDGTGTGFIVGENGYILTCAHVLPLVGDPKVSYETKTGTASKVIEARAEVVRIDKRADLALLKIEVSSPLRTVQLCTRRPVESAEEVTVIGNPGVGETILKNTVTTGVISNVRRNLDGLDLVQTSAPINPGNSGGPMFNDRGQVVGVVVSKARLENTGFAIPIDQVVSFLGVDEAPVGEAKRATPRIWSDASGRFSVTASLIRVADDRVQLRRKDNGEVISVPISILSPKDQQYLRKVQE